MFRNEQGCQVVINPLRVTAVRVQRQPNIRKKCSFFRTKHRLASLCSCCNLPRLLEKYSCCAADPQLLPKLIFHFALLVSYHSKCYFEMLARIALLQARNYFVNRRVPTVGTTVCASLFTRLAMADRIFSVDLTICLLQASQMPCFSDVRAPLSLLSGTHVVCLAFALAICPGAVFSNDSFHFPFL